jgi:2-keto-4-pentenoate hydratase/2-oxohepta-3-ene-1,7-dioic acid hydratase in catechol pathway
MRLATILEAGRPTLAVVEGDRCLAVPPDGGLGTSIREIAGHGPDALHRLAAWVDAQPRDAGRPLDDVVFAAAVPDPGAIYTVGLNYRSPGVGPGDPDAAAPPRPLIYGKAATSVAGHGATLTWDRTLTANVDPEIELGVVIGATAAGVSPEMAMDHVFGYTCINDVSSRDPWLDGDQWLLGKSMPGFCPAGPWIVTADEIDPADLRLGCTINGVPIQHGRTSQLRTPIADVVAYLSRHATLRPGDLIATGTPPRLDGPLGPDRHLEPGDIVTVWVEGVGELTTTIA